MWHQYIIYKTEWSTRPAHRPGRQWLSLDFEVLGRTDGWAGNLCENSDHYRPELWSASWINLSLSARRQNGWGREWEPVRFLIKLFYPVRFYWSARPRLSRWSLISFAQGVLITSVLKTKLRYMAGFGCSNIW